MDELDNIIELEKHLYEIALKCDIFIVGAGKFGDILGRWLDKKNIVWKGYLDKSKHGECLNGKTILPFGKPKDGEVYYFISSVKYYDEMKSNLLQKGIPEKKIGGFKNIEPIYEIYATVSDYKNYTKKIEKYHNFHKDITRCFIVGNGPSLKIEDLEKLCKEKSFACNSVYALYELVKWRPTYYFLCDLVASDLIFDKKEETKKIIDECKTAFTTIMGKGFKYRDDEEMRNLYYLKRIQKMEEKTNMPLFSDNCSEVIYGGGSTAYVMIQLAVYMGFKEIYLIGMDLDFSCERYVDGNIVEKNKVNHMSVLEEDAKRFYKANKLKTGYNYIADVDLQKAHYLAAKKYADEHGIKIYNATRGGKLEVFKRVDFDTLF